MRMSLRCSYLITKCNATSKCNGLTNLKLLNVKFVYSKLYKHTIRHHSRVRYEKAISTLNSLQSNAATLNTIRKNRNKAILDNVDTTQKYLERIELGQDDLKKLNIIHVSGTKGKGSTCAFIESILYEHGYKVGFYSSPHLVVARERIRIGKRLITEKIFTDNFWHVYKLLKLKQSYDGDMPAYFKFLTLLAFRIFLKEKVDIAIFEVGIGGEYDCTNVIRSPVVCGITSLDLDHTSILGNTIEAIAWQKAGIMKSGVPTFTVDHSISSLNVIRERGIEKQSPLLLVPELVKYSYSKDSSGIQLGLDGSVQLINASLALQISNYWIKANSGNEDLNMDEYKAEPFHLSVTHLSGLRNVTWPGRSQIEHRGGITYFIDGAHTMTSISACVDWFHKASLAQSIVSSFKILIFNITGDRDPLSLLQPLLCLNFDLAIFTTNMVAGSMDVSSDQKSVGVTEKQQLEKCRKIKTIWDSMYKNNIIKPNGEKSNSVHETPSVTFPYIRNTIDWLMDKDNFKTYGILQHCSVQVLVTGSMHLVGGILAVIDPEMACMDKTLNCGPILKQKKLNNGII